MFTSIDWSFLEILLLGLRFLFAQSFLAQLVEIQRVFFELFRELVAEEHSIPFEAEHVAVNKPHLGDRLLLHCVPIELKSPSKCVKDVDRPDVISEIPGHEEYLVLQKAFAKIDGFKQIATNLTLFFICWRFLRGII